MISIFNHFIFGINYKFSDFSFHKKGIDLDNKKYIVVVKLEKRFKCILNAEEEDKLKYSVITTITSDKLKPIIKIEQDIISDYKSSSDYNKRNIIENAKDKITVMYPIHYFEKSIKSLERNIWERFKNESKNKPNAETITIQQNIFNDEIRKILIYFFTSILVRYELYCTKFKCNTENSVDEGSNIITNLNFLNYWSKKTNGERNEKVFERDINLDRKYILGQLKIEDMFNIDGFMEDTSTPKLDKPFYKKFFSTQIFFHFMKKKIFPISILDKLEVLYFDNKVNERLAKESRKIKFLTKNANENYMNLSGKFYINLIKREPSESMIKFFNVPKNIKKGLNYFQSINLEDSLKKENKNRIRGNSDFNENDMPEVEPQIGFTLVLHKAYIEKEEEKEEISDEEIKDQKLNFSYYVFPKLLNDNILIKEKINQEEIYTGKNKDRFNLKNCRSIYNQFEKQAYLYIGQDIIQSNYNQFEYNLRAELKYKFTYEEYIRKLWLLYLAKSFDRIPFSKRRYYFEKILMVLKDKNNQFEENVIISLYNAINQYGDSLMNQEMFMLLDRKSYIHFLTLKQKTNSLNNFMRFVNITNIRASKISVNSAYFDMNENTDKSPDKTRKTKLFDFFIYAYCSPGLDEIKKEEENKDEVERVSTLKINKEEICGEPLVIDIKDWVENKNKNNSKYVEIKCNKCGKVQNLQMACTYTDESGDKYQFVFYLVSPTMILERTWFKNKNKLDILYISRNYAEEYLSSIFYFYDQGLSCNFLVPRGISEEKLDKELTSTYNSILATKEYLNSLHKNPTMKRYYSPVLKKRELNILEKINIYSKIKDKEKERERGNKVQNKSPSPKRMSVLRRTNILKEQNKRPKNILWENNIK